VIKPFFHQKYRGKPQFGLYNPNPKILEHFLDYGGRARRVRVGKEIPGTNFQERIIVWKE